MCSLFYHIEWRKAMFILAFKDSETNEMESGRFLSQDRELTFEFNGGSKFVEGNIWLLS